MSFIAHPSKLISSTIWLSINQKEKGQKPLLSRRQIVKWMSQKLGSDLNLTSTISAQTLQPQGPRFFHLSSGELWEDHIISSFEQLRLSKQGTLTAKEAPDPKLKIVILCIPIIIRAWYMTEMYYKTLNPTHMSNTPVQKKLLSATHTHTKETLKKFWVTLWLWKLI